jgi:hypothetical protein
LIESSELAVDWFIAAARCQARRELTGTGQVKKHLKGEATQSIKKQVGRLRPCPQAKQRAFRIRPIHH